MALQVQERTTIRKVDYNLALVIFAINIIGLINLYSATHRPNSKVVASLFVSQISSHFCYFYNVFVCKGQTKCFSNCIDWGIMRTSTSLEIRSQRLSEK